MIGALAQLRRLYHHVANGGVVTADDLSQVIVMLERRMQMQQERP